MKKYLLTGLVILLPLVLTLIVIFFLFDLFTEPFVHIVGNWVDRLQDRFFFILPKDITLFVSRIFSLIFLCVFILILGIVTRWFVVKNLIGWANLVILRIPFVNTVYKVSRDVFNALFSTDGKKAFKRPVMIPFPTRPNFCLGFHAGEIAEECQQKVKTPLVPVIFPTAPHPISGFLFLVPEQDVYDIDMSNEEVFKFLVSCGMIVPEKEMEKEKTDEFS